MARGAHSRRSLRFKRYRGPLPSRFSALLAVDCSNSDSYTAVAHPYVRKLRSAGVPFAVPFDIVASER